MDVPMPILTILTNIALAGQIAIIVWCVKQIMDIKQNYIKQFGEIKLKIEETKNLFIQENTTTRHQLRNEMQGYYGGFHKEFVTREECARVHES
jgi:hypothetical protein